MIFPLIAAFAAVAPATQPVPAKPEPIICAPDPADNREPDRAMCAKIIAAIAVAQNRKAEATAGRHARGKTPASLAGSASLANLFSTEDYPADAAEKGEEGATSVRLTIAADGRVVACVVTNSSGSQSLDRATCGILQQRARYRPALDRKGNPIIDHDVARVRWMLPLEEVRDQFARATYDLDPAARAPTCKSEGEFAGPTMCTYFEPARDLVVKAPNGPKSGSFIVEYGIMVGDGAALAKAGGGVGQWRWGFNAVTLKIDADGTVTDCLPYPGVRFIADAQAKCAGVRRHKFEPLPAAARAGPGRTMTSYEISYLRDVQTPPRPDNLKELFTPDDYPPDALKQNREGRVGVKAMVDPDGQARSCTVAVPSGTPSLDSTTCRLVLARGRFTPGTDVHGKAVRSEWSRLIAWRMPTETVRDQATKFILSLGPDGSVSSCEIVGEPSSEFDCNNAKVYAALALKSPNAKGNRSVVLETGAAVGPGESVAHVGEGPGQTSWSTSLVTIGIDADGKPVDCKASLDSDEDEFTQASCELAKTQRFEPLGAGVANRSPRYLTRYDAIYFVR